MRSLCLTLAVLVTFGPFLAQPVLMVGLEDARLGGCVMTLSCGNEPDLPDDAAAGPVTASDACSFSRGCELPESGTSDATADAACDASMTVCVILGCPGIAVAHSFEPATSVTPMVTVAAIPWHDRNVRPPIPPPRRHLLFS